MDLLAASNIILVLGATLQTVPVVVATLGLTWTLTNL